MKTSLLALALLALAFRLQEKARAPVAPAPPPAYAAFDLAELNRQAREAQRGWTTFLDRSTMEVGLYRLAAGSADHQSPHEFDEVYVVTRGRAKLEVGGTALPAHEGSVLFIAARQPHRFLEIEEDLEVLVFFSKKKG